jgi:FkbM family methyltransferase
MKKVIIGLCLAILILATYIFIQNYRIVRIDYLAQVESVINYRESTYLWNLNNERFSGLIISDEDGKDMVIDKNDNMVSAYIINYRIWEPHVRQVMRQIIKPSDNVLSLGGHLGVHVGLISRLIGDKGMLYIFEPNPDVLRYLKLNISINNSAYNIQLFEKAAYSENTKLKFIARDSSENSGSSHILFDWQKKQNNENIIEVDSIKIDDINEIKDIDILQMDIEGAEPYAVMGAKNLIKNSPNLKVIQEWGNDMKKEVAAEYIKFWRELGYKIGLITCDAIIEKTDKEVLELPLSDIIIAKNLDEIIKNFTPCPNKAYLKN